jgi:hypothetical protein
MTHQDEARFPAGSKIILIMPPFSLFITGDLSYYADVLGMPNSSSYWCPWCLLSHADWNQPPETFNAEERTLEFLTEVSLAVKNDSERKLKPIDRKGATCERHYKSLSPLNFVPPLLHLEIGMVNQAWDALEDWVDDAVKIIPPHEKAARREVSDTKERLNIALDNKKEADATINIEIREKSGEAASIEAHLRRKGLENSTREELKVQLTLLETFINEQRNKIKKFKEEVKKIQLEHAEAKKKLIAYREERGKPEASIAVEIEMHLEKYNASHAAYHRGDYNGVSCRRIVGNSTEIASGIKTILESKRDERCNQATINKKVNELEHTLGLLDAAFFYLNIPHPSDEEKKKQAKLSMLYQSIGGALG